MLESIENKDKEIALTVNEVNGEDENFDISFSDLEVWDDGDESITFFFNKINNNGKQRYNNSRIYGKESISTPPRK